MADLIGRELGRYHILEQLGEGGMAVVYKAYDTRLEADVAVKVIRTEVLPQNGVERALKRFEREAKLLARLTHPNIVKVMDYGEYEGKPYLVMPYLPGGTLKEKLGRQMPWQEAAKLLLPVARALDYAHRQGMIHRDVKPSNILITSDGDPMLTDFGIAKILETEGGQTLTGTGVGVGTPEYMAPEQGMGKEIDARADVYGLGVVFYELVSGRKPYIADTPMMVIFKHMSDPLPRPKSFVPDLPQEVENVLLKALAKNPEDRYENMAGFLDALEGLHSGKVKIAPAPAKKPQPQSEPGKSGDPQATIDQRLIAPSAPVAEKPVLAGRSPKTKLLFGFSVVGVLIFVLVVVAGSLIGRDQQVTVPPSDADIGSEWLRPVDGMTMAYVPEGPFSMGSNDGASDERPVHTVRLDAFWIDKTEVTNAMYAKCVQTGDCSVPSSGESSSRSSYYRNSDYADYPVIYVSWENAKVYCTWAGARLPTEAEWEKAARGMDGRTYPWGDPIDCGLANYDPGSYCAGNTTAVGTYPEGASPYGAFDMAGNVWEWVADWYDADYYSNSPQSNPRGASSGEYRVLRGGSWNVSGNGARASYRSWSEPSYSHFNIGFRCSR